MDAKQRNQKQPNVLWIDLEMTGLEPENDRILEVGAIITDWDFAEKATYESAVQVDAKLLENRVFKGPSAAFWESVPETRDALLTQNNSATKSAEKVEDELLALVAEHFTGDAPIILAGNSIHMDRRFIEREWPRLNKLLHYRMLDVSAWKVVLKTATKRNLPNVRRTVRLMIFVAVSKSCATT